MTELISKGIDFLSKPINITILLAIFLTSLFIFGFNFFPENILERMNLLNFLNDYNYIVFLVLVASFFLLAIQLITIIIKKQQRKKFNRLHKEQQEKLFNDPDAYEILQIVYENHPNPVRLPVQNQKVLLLKQFGLISYASTQTALEWYEDINNPRFPFVLQPVAEEKLKNENRKSKKKTNQLKD